MTVVLKVPDIVLRGDGDDRPIPAGQGVNLKVERVDGPRVLVVLLDHSRGWIGIDQVLPRDQAMAWFDRAIERNPKDVDALRMRGRLCNDRKEYDRALADLDQAIRLCADRAPAYADRGRVLLYGKDQADRALADCDKAIQLDPKLAPGYGQRGACWAQKGDHDKAIADFDEAIRLDPNWAWFYGQRGRSWSNKGHPDKAIADFTQVIRLDPRDSVALCTARPWLADERRSDKALADCDEAIKLDPKYAYSYFVRANAWIARGDLDKALADCDAAIKLDPNDAFNHFARGRAWSQGATWTRPSPISRNPSGWIPSPGLSETAASCWQKKGEFDKALADCDAAIKLDPKTAYNYFARGEAGRQGRSRQGDHRVLGGHPAGTDAVGLRTARHMPGQEGRARQGHRRLRRGHQARPEIRDRL